MDNYENYILGSDISCKGEILNSLTTFDRWIAKKQPNLIVELHLVGGSAFLLKDMEIRVTLDIDTIKRLSSEVREVAGDLGISDGASEVVVLPSGYEKRMTEYKNNYTNIKVFLVADSDLIISKLGTDRPRDITDIRKSNILRRVNVSKLESSIIDTYSDGKRDSLLRDLHQLPANFAGATSVF